jgi:large subunit ribosomal protein L18Ae
VDTYAVRGSSPLPIQIRQYVVIGRAKPSDKEANPTLFRMRVFAKDQVRARSKFWYFLKRYKNIRKVQGQTVAVHEVGKQK